MLWLFMGRAARVVLLVVGAGVARKWEKENDRTDEKTADYRFVVMFWAALD